MVFVTGKEFTYQAQIINVKDNSNVQKNMRDDLPVT